MTAFKFSKRSAKYVWLTLPGLCSIALTGIWLVSVAPGAQLKTRQETDWRQEVLAQKQRADFLEENQIHSDYDQLIFSGTSADQEDLAAVLYTWSEAPESQVYGPGQTVRLLDQFHACMGYYIGGDGLYLARDNPGLCDAANADVKNTLENSKSI